MAIVLQLLSRNALITFLGWLSVHSSFLGYLSTEGHARNSAAVALQLCPPLQFGPLTYQPIEWGFISSNQSALRSCLLHVTSQLGEGCSMTFVRFVFLIPWMTCVWNSFGAFSPMGFLRILQKFEVCSKLSRSTHMFICWRARIFELESLGQGWKHNKEFEEGQ